MNTNRHPAYMQPTASAWIGNILEQTHAALLEARAEQRDMLELMFTDNALLIRLPIGGYISSAVIN